MLHSVPRRVSCRAPACALHNLRAVVILIVLAFHSVLAYVQWIPQSTASFDDPPYQWRAFPILDSHRWFGFDLFCAWQDVYLMSLMFLLSGLFVWPSLQRKRRWGFVRDRLRRLGFPYVFGLLVLMPIAFYPAYLATGGDPSVSRLFAALYRAAVPAERPAMVSVAAARAEFRGGRAQLGRAQRDQRLGPLVVPPPANAR